jgi:hypothetical protein
MSVRSDRECGQKTQFLTRQAAVDGMWAMKRATPAIISRMKVYHCNFCSFWHFGHQRKTGRRR